VASAALAPRDFLDRLGALLPRWDAGVVRAFISLFQWVNRNGFDSPV
jgi:hypothetical protein